MLMEVGKHGKSCLICLDRLDLVCQQDMPSRHPKTQRRSGLKRLALKIEFEESLLKSIIKATGAGTPLRRKCRQKRGSLK